jgi:hypothetical protein
MSKRPIAAMLLLAAALALPAAAYGQSLVTGTITGSVRNAFDQPVREAMVVLTGGHGAPRITHTRPDGGFDMLFVVPGDYELRVEQLGFRPHVLPGLAVLAERAIHLDIRLAEGEPPFAVIDTTFMPRAVGHSRVTASERLWENSWLGAPLGDRSLEQLLRTASRADPAGFGRPGANGGMGIVVDGVPVGQSGRLFGAGTLPLFAIRTAELAVAPVDVELAGFGSGLLVLHTARGPNAWSGRGYADFSGGGLVSSPGFGSGSIGNSSVRAGATVGGPIVGDSAHASVTVEFERATLPLWQNFALGDEAEQWRGRAAGRSVDLGRFEGVRGAERNSLRAFGRFDWQVAEGHELSVRAGALQAPESEATVAGSRFATAGNAFDTRELAAFAGLTSELFGGLLSELRLTFQAGERGLTAGADTGGIATFFVPLGAGIAAVEPGATRTAARLFGGSETLHFRYGAHQLKAGLHLETARHERGEPVRAQYLYGGGAAFDAGLGVFSRRARATVPDFAITRQALFAQDRWTPAPGLDVVIGGRYELERLPSTLFSADTAWLRLTGLRGLQMQPEVRGISVRGGFLWDVQAAGVWQVNGSAGVYNDRLPAELVGEIIGLDRGVQVQRVAGTLDGWPGGQPSAGAWTGTALTLPAPALDAPRTVHATFGVTRAIGGAATIGVSFVNSATEFLPRRFDLNRHETPLAVDQHGRPIFGRPVKQDELIVAEPGTNRRFSDFDIVSVIQTDGTSEHRAATVALERHVGGALRLVARYTFAETTDDWFGAASPLPEAQIAPMLPVAEQDTWLRGRSDFDVPHRAAVGAMFSRPLGTVALEAGMIYHMQSGLPFTPGFRPGVDASGDGSGFNDPAFIDDAVAGMGDLIDRWDCLRQNVGGWTLRNACRAENVQTLDARVALGLGFAGGRRAQLVLEGTGLIGAGGSPVDAALYRIAAGAPLVEADGVIRLPLVANPNFGEPILRRSTGRALRIGVQLQF